MVLYSLFYQNINTSKNVENNLQIEGKINQ
jgi:hypothetical protein